jgi:NAD+ synthase
MKNNLTIDTDLTLQIMKLYLQGLVETQKSKGLLLGLSGGIDSSVLTTIAVKAVGKEHVHVSFLYDRDSEKSSEEKARTIANWLGIELEIADISEAMKQRKVYAPLIMNLISYSAAFNRMIQHVYCLINRETPFKTSLKVGSQTIKPSWLKRVMFNLSIRHFDRGFSERHIHRRQVLEQKAKEENLTLIGAANLSEFQVGWFVKDGIDDLPVQPMAGLYKTQVWQLASYLELPDEIQSQLASPDMMLGITDEFGIGHNYRRLDVMLDLIDQHKTDKEIIDCGISKVELEDVHDLMKYSEWKRASDHEIPPVQGVIGGNVRLDSNMDEV